MRLVLFGLAALAANAGAVWAQEDLTGSNSFIYQEQKAADESRTELWDAFNLLYRGMVSPQTELSLYGNVIWQQGDNLDNPSLRPFAGARLSSDLIWINSTYSFIQDRNYQKGAATLETENWSTAIGLHPEDLPAVTVNYNWSATEDDANTIDNERTTASFQVTHDIRDLLSITYLHSDIREVDRLAPAGPSVVFQQPNYVAVDGSGSVYVVDAAASQVLKFNTSGGLILTWGGAGAGPGQFTAATGIAVDPAGNVYIADAFLGRVQKFDGNGTFLLQWGIPGAGPGQFNSPNGMAADATGIYVADTNNNRIQKFDTNGVFLLQWGTPGIGPGQFAGPEAVASDGTNVYVADTTNHRVQRFDTTGTFLLQWGAFGAANGLFSSPRGIAADAAGSVYVADTGNNRVQQFTSAGAFVAAWGATGAAPGEFSTPLGAAVDTASNVYVVDSDNDRVQRFLPGGTFILSWGNAPPPAGESRRRSKIDSLGGTFRYDLGERVGFSAGFGVDRSISEDSLLPWDTESILYRFAPTLGMRILENAHLTYNLSLQRQETEMGPNEFERRSLAQNASLTLTPHARVVWVLSYQDALARESTGVETRASGPSTTVTVRPYRFVNLNLGLSRNLIETDGQRASLAYAFTSFATVDIFRANSLVASYSRSMSETFATDTEATTDTVSLDAYLFPWRRLSITARNSFSLSTTDSSESESWSLSPAVSWLVPGGAAITASLTWAQADSSTGPATDRLTGVTNFSYQWEGSTASVFYSINRDETAETGVLGSTLRVAVSRATVVGLYGQRTISGDSEGDGLLRVDIIVSF